jgi:hypothetical protein
MVENPQSPIDLGTSTPHVPFHNLALLWLTVVVGLAVGWQLSQSRLTVAQKSYQAAQVSAESDKEERSAGRACEFV